MLRNYARLLRLDADALLERLGERLEAPDSDRLAARFKQPVPFSNNTRRSTLAYGVMSLLILGAVGGLAYEWQQERSSARQLAFVAAAKAPLEPRAAPELPPEPAAATAQKSPAAAAANPPAPVVAKATAQPEAVPAAETRPESTPAPAAGVHRIVVSCEQECWIELKDGLERQLVSSLNPAGTERVVRGRAPFDLVIGNAQHVRVTYDGRPIDLQPHTRVEVARFTLQ
jgi:cytoskeleton protein RodZ